MATQQRINFASAHLKYQLTRGLWLINKQAAYAQLPTVFDFIDNKIIVDDNQDEPKLTIPYTINIINSSQSGRSRNIAVIPVMGSLMKSDYCGAPGMQTIISRIKRAEEDDSISGIFFHVDSPGGTVDGTQELSDTIKNCSKPTLGFADGLAASGGYWVISSTDLVVAKDTTTEVGSVGVVLSFMDNRKALKEKGYEIHDVFADGSPEKWKEMLDAEKGDYSTLKEWTLNPILDEFQNSVRENMPGISEKALKGRVFLAKQAKKLKMINKIGNFDFAVKELNKLISNKNKIIMTQDNKGKVIEMTISEDEKGFFDKLVSYIKPEIKDISEDTKAEFEDKITENAIVIENLNDVVKELTTKNEALEAEKLEATKLIDISVIENKEIKTELSDLKVKLTKEVIKLTSIESEDDKLEIGDMSDEEKSWIKDASTFVGKL